MKSTWIEDANGNRCSAEYFSSKIGSWFRKTTTIAALTLELRKAIKFLNIYLSGKGLFQS